MTNIPESTVSAYVARYPSLARLAANATAGSQQATLAFARNALRLEVPAGVSIRAVWDLSAFAEPPA